MFGKVYGPYTLKTGHKYVHIVLHNEDGSVKEASSISYERYMKEVDEGLHQYIIPITSKQQYKVNNKNKCISQSCGQCNKDFFTNKIINSPVVFCSKNCKKKYQRAIKRKQTLSYYNQIVVVINNGDINNKHFIIYDRNNNHREQLFIKADKTRLLITEDNNGIVRYRLIYDSKDAIRIRPALGYKKIFWITETGVLVSKRTKRILNQTIGQTGYYTHATKIGGRKGKAICLKIHRLVAAAFIPNPENKPFINHKNGIKTDNHWTNLEWVTSSENMQHAADNGLIKYNYGESHHSSKFTNIEANKIRELSKSLSMREIARRNKVGHSTIGKIVNNETYI